jgi:pyruvate-formate lyase-activating enzyme
MTEQERKNEEALQAIGRELSDLSVNGTLDFEAFQRLLKRAIAEVGADYDLEMFCGYARGEGWFAWMVQEIQKSAAAQRVA